MKALSQTGNQIMQMAAATPDSRERYVDFLRAFSIAVVVFGHWLMAIVYWGQDGLTGDNALNVVPGLWLATWVLQVMPLFFFVGGFSNLVTIDATRKKGGTYGEFLRGRIHRLLKPTLVFVGVWIVVAAAIEAIAPSAATSLANATEILAKPLWFLAVYVLLVALAPSMLSLHRRFGARVLFALAIAAAAADVIRLAAGVTFVGYFNFAFVWLFAHQLGFFYAEGTLARLGRRVHAGMAATGLAALFVLTNIGVYSPSLVGMNSDLASNNSPPTVCLIALTTWLVGAAMLLRPAVSRWLSKTRPWAYVIGANSMIMTVFLWHLTALFALVLVAYPLGFAQPAGGTAEWWALRPVWIGLLLVALVPFVALFGRFERPTRGKTVAAVKAISPARVSVGTAAVVFGLSGFATAGFAGVLSAPAQVSALGAGPLVSAISLAAGARFLTGTKAA